MSTSVSLSYYAYVGDRRVTLTQIGARYWVKLWPAAKIVDAEDEGKRYSRLVEAEMPLDADNYGTLSLATEAALQKYNVKSDGWYLESTGKLSGKLCT